MENQRHAGVKEEHREDEEQQLNQNGKRDKYHPLKHHFEQISQRATSFSQWKSRSALLQLGNHLQPAVVAAALVFGVQPDGDDLKCEVFANNTGAHGQHVGVVVPAGHLRP